MTVDLTPVLQIGIQIAALVLMGLLARYTPRIIAAAEAWLHIKLTDQQRAVVLGAVQTAAGAIETKLDQGVMQVAHVQVGNAGVAAEANAAIGRVPGAMAALGMTPDNVAAMIVGAVDTATHGPVMVAAQPQGATP